MSRLHDADPRELLRPCALELLVACPVSPRVNKPQNNDCDLVQAIDVVKPLDEDAQRRMNCA